MRPLGAGEGDLPPLELWQPPEVLTAREVCDLPLPTTAPILGADDRGPLILPGWRIIVGGQTGVGKTVLTLHMIRAHVKGESFLAWRGYGGRALVLDLEQGLRTVQRRLEETGLDESDKVDYVRIPDGMALDSNETQRAWLEGVLGGADYGIVALDPWYKMHTGDPNDERLAVDLMRHLDGWRDRMGFSLIIPAHLRKADKTGRSKATIDDISGAGAIVRGAEVVLGLHLKSGIPESGEGYGKSKLHFWKDRDGDLPVGATWDLKFRPDEGYSIDESAKRTTAERVREVMARSWPDKLSLEDIAQRLALAKRTIDRTVKAMQKDGLDLVTETGPHGVLLYGLSEVYDDEDMEDW